jgi:hypothetical protein
MKRFINSTAALILGVLFLSTTGQAQADTKSGQVVFSEDFSSGNLDQWQPTRDDGQYWQVVDGQAEVTVPSRSTITELIPKDELWNKDWQNIEYSYQLTPLQGIDRNTSFGWEDLRNWFEVHFITRLMNLVRIDDGSLPINIFKNYKMVNGQTYYVVIKIENQTITVTVNGKQVAKITDSKYINNGGKIGLKAGTGAVYPTKMRYDNIQVKWFGGQNKVELAVPIFKQHDSAWGDTQYDHADLWSSQPSMTRWGCLTTSMAMVMNYHGIDKMMDGTPLTPATLNQWLVAEVDGYLGQGMFNWVAASRLTRQLSEKYGTPKLEYARIAGVGIGVAIDHLRADQPSILEVAGHFLVGKGFTSDEQELLINDPAYDYQELGQHDTKLVSTRTLTPSYTDLSYLLLTHSPDLEVSVSDENGQAVVGWEKFTEQLRGHDEELQPATAVQQLAKPAAGTYLVSISQESLKQYQLSILAYDLEANPSSFVANGWVGSEPLVFKIKYQPTGSSQISQQTSFSKIRTDLSYLRQENLITKQQQYQQLDRLAAAGEKAEQAGNTKKQIQLISQLDQLTNSFNKWFDGNAQQYFLQEIEVLRAQITQ